jgi:hypothetical protein
MTFRTMAIKAQFGTRIRMFFSKMNPAGLAAISGAL